MILVTGGAGFIGAHLVERLMLGSEQVVVVDNFSTGSNTVAGTTPLLADICDMNWGDCSVFVNLTQIYHLACPASPKAYQADPLGTLKTNIIGTMNVLDLAKAHGAKVVFASTSEVYGDPLVHPQPESYWGNVNPLGERSCYDEGKRAAETLCQEYRKAYGLDIKIARIFNTYGPRMSPDDGRVVSNFIMQALTNKPLTIYGDGHQTRSFCYVDDTVEGLVRLMTSEETGPINIGNPHEITLLNLIRRIEGILGLTIAKEYKPLPSDDPARREPDISLAMERLGWEPMVDINTGLKKTIAYFRQFAGTSDPVPPCEETEIRFAV